MLIAERYRLGASLGRGGMGEVFRARDESLGREVAVKLMLGSGEDTSAAERFRREARAAARLSDPHIVAVYDFGQYDDTYYLVMELVEGRSVGAELAESGSLPWDRAVTIVEQAAAGLAVAHAQDVVHRDIKPSNLMVAADGTVKVADFGIAQMAGAEANELTVTGEILGSPPYLAPERARGLQAGPEADVYALGCVLYQLVTGRPPFVGDHPAAVLYQHVDADPVPPSELDPELAGPYEALLLRMLAKAPWERPTAAQLTEMRGAAELFPTAPLPSGAGPDAPAEPPAGPAAGAPAGDQPARRRTAMIAAAAALVLAAVVGAGLALRHAGDDQPPTVDVGPQPSKTTGTPSASTTEPTTEQTQPGPVNETTQNTPTAPSASLPSATPSTPSATPTTTPPSPTTSPSTTPSPTPTKSSTSPTPSSTPTSETPTPTPTPKPSDTPAPSGTPTP
ncbi:serine/threonine-protein kinase [Kribbella sp. NPDC048928]|uniref:serine/threonine-protein kinase n=1 Tax=Kribbella sp. NPDC048928 TaxID=3364111 RepID=UPI0037198CFA